ncbi:hypothetical protein DFJ58DRAFT_840189 [Suillus subalutaceus]|uniref:uncharacterized protein n=1 Tax=Suillus subalutaceus TaxID=48586 RepID=UPI001B8814A1|nr:uncharacterized protein DFJ58DRAFT_840189 [Suillus subalutaceus]KAG1859317.1 hypothetical protein DFJ58DRAFT_840189 [Suillus subalutaceus]
MSTTPPPKKTFRSRVGTVMRRSSTSWGLPGLPNRPGSTTPPLPEPDSASIAGSTSPKLEREGSTTSLTQVETTRSTPPPPGTIPESPAREEAALASEMSPQQISSPLSGGSVTAEPAPDPSIQAPEESRKAAEAPKPESDFVIPSVVVNSPEQAKENALSPVFTDEPEEMSPGPPAERAQVSAPPASTKAPDAAPTPTPVPSTTPPPAPAREPTPPSAPAREPTPPSAPARAPTPPSAPAREPTPPSAPAREPTPPSAPARKPTPPVLAATPPPAGKAADDPSTAPAPAAASAPPRTRASTPPAHPSEVSRVPPSAPPTPPARTPGPATATGYFDLSVPRTSSPLDEHVEEGANVWADHISTSPPPAPPAPAPAPAPAPEFDPLANRPAAPKVAKTTSRARGSSVSSAQVMAQRQPSRKPSSTLQPREREIVGTTYTWSNPSSEFNQSKASLIMPSEDPFADQGPRAPGHHIYPPQQSTEISSPIVHDNGRVSHFDPRSPRDDSMVAPAEPVAVPLPALHEVMLTHSVRQVSSGYTSSDGASTGYFQSRDIPIETKFVQIGICISERQPLITRPGRPTTPPIVTTFSPPSPSTQSYHSHTFDVSHPTPQRAQPARLEGNGSAHTYSYGSVSRPYAGRGWIEQALPHGAKYFVNPRIQATTDVDLRNLSKLDAVMSVVETAGSAPEGCEMWARDGPVVKRGWRRQKMAGGPVISWVDHRIRRVSSQIPSVDGIIFSGEDDRLDDEYRYWSFVETHPAHISLPPSARQEALDALHWSYTDPLLAHPQPIPPPFTQDECHKLLGHLNDPNLRSTTTHTRMIARILLRVAHWRQTNFRPHKPLPRDVPIMQRPKRRVPIGRMIADILTGILCLGIPFFLVDRSNYGGHVDLEGNIVSNSGGPLFLAGACACLVAAVILSASVTLMTLPGLSGVARMSGLVAIMCSVLSMITSFISIIRHKAEMAHGTPTSGSEGFVLLTALSLALLSTHSTE